MRKSGGLVCCLLAAFFWGTTFVAQDTAAKTIPAFTFLALRSFVGAAALLVVFLVKDHIHKKRGTFVPVEKGTHKRTLLGGAFCGLFLCAASALQQLGIAGNAGSPGKDAFITALYIVFVPLFGLFLGNAYLRMRSGGTRGLVVALHERLGTHHGRYSADHLLRAVCVSDDTGGYDRR